MCTHENSVQKTFAVSRVKTLRATAGENFKGDDDRCWEERPIGGQEASAG